MGFNNHNLYHKSQRHWTLHITLNGATHIKNYRTVCGTLCGTNRTLNGPTHSIHMEAIGVYGTIFQTY